MRTKLLKQMKIALQKEPPPIEVPDHLPPLPAMIAAFGTRGSGKTTATQSLLRNYKAEGLAHRVFLISPTYASNKFQFEGLVDEEDVFEAANQQSLDEVIRRGRQETQEYDDWQIQKELFHLYKKQEREVLAGKRKKIDGDLFQAAIEHGVQNMETFPPYKYNDCPAGPIIWLVLDDAQSSSIFNPSTKHAENLSNVLIKNRHVLSTPANRYGLSIVLAMQNYKLQVGGISKAIRMNLTCVMLYGYRDPKLIEAIQEELGNAVSPEVFQKAYAYATAGEPWNFLMIEFKYPVRLRHNFDEILLIENFSDEVADGSESEAESESEGAPTAS